VLTLGTSSCSQVSWYAASVVNAARAAVVLQAPAALSVASAC